MRRTRKRQAARYLTLLIAGAVLPLAVKPAAPRVRGAGSSAAIDAIVQTIPTPTRGRYNGKIVFTSDRHTSSSSISSLSIWTMNPDGSSPTRLTDEKSLTVRLPSFARVYDSQPAWSPDGTKIAFISINRNLSSGLYIMNADGSNIQLVTDKVLEPQRPSWSPDGGKIAFTGGMGMTFEPNKPFADVYVVNVDGSGPTKLTSDSGVNSSPTWSPDGKRIAFSSNRELDGQPKIWVMNADGSNQRRLTDVQNNSNSRFYGVQPSWSPDGTKILFNSYRQIFVMNADGSNPRALTNDLNRSGMYSSPRWSPDGTKIVTAFQLDSRNGSGTAIDIIVMNADGSDQIKVSNRVKYDFDTSGSTFFDVDADWQPLLAQPNFASSVVGFSAPSYTVYEDAGSVPITVSRTGNLNDVASCSYITLNDTATIKYYDPAASGTLRFAPGELSKTISIAISDSSGARGSWSLKVALSDNEGNATFIGGHREATVTILGRATVLRTKKPN